MSRLKRSRFPKLLLITIYLILFTLLTNLNSPVFSDWEGDIDDITQELESDFQFGGKEEIKAENLEQANSQNREDVQIGRSISSLSGTYASKIPFGPLMGNLIIYKYQVSDSGNFRAAGKIPNLNTLAFILKGKITGKSTTFKITRIQIPGPPTNFVACKNSAFVTGSFSGSAAGGIRHSFSRPALCNEPQGIMAVHKKQ